MRISKVSELRDMLEKFIEHYGDLPLADIDVLSFRMMPVRSAVIMPMEIDGKLFATFDMYTLENSDRLE